MRFCDAFCRPTGMLTPWTALRPRLSAACLLPVCDRKWIHASGARAAVEYRWRTGGVNVEGGEDGTER